MYFNNKISVALLAALAAGSEASHARNHKLFHARNVNSTVSTSSVFVYPTPILTPSSSVPAGSSPVASSSAAASSSVVTSSTSDASSSVITQAPPLGTGVPGSSDAGDDNSGSATDITITYTLGTGTSKSVVTTTIHKTATNTETVYATPAVPSAGSEEQTTTLHSTATSTVTVVEVPSSSAASGNAGNGGSEACTGQATVTVTATVTETVTGAPSATAKPGDDYTKPHDQDHQKNPGNSGNPGKNSGNNDEDEDENDQGENDNNGGAESTKAPLPVPTHTGRPPFGNGTLPIPTSGVAKPTGFLTSSKHAFPTNFRRSH
ncbi:hypothetical protein BDV39DRAFT_185265 [Aspergillus sergii]|uniref:Uncharacterized protein n=1 Tax=Aspergillus sergii TaxID=1034303 RepID=A0A5N6WPD8_9EURO|nr:hypothetical protein BDV39DRAFT_185265 [Aspergillus sergii]